MSRLPRQHFELYHQIMIPLLQIEADLEPADNNIIKTHARTALVFAQGIRDILDDLIFDYEIVKIEYATVNDPELKSMVDQLMTQMVKLQMEISDKLVDLKHAHRA